MVFNVRELAVSDLGVGPEGLIWTQCAGWSCNICFICSGVQHGAFEQNSHLAILKQQLRQSLE